MNKIISMPLLKENVKRFWGFSFVTFLAYFLSTNFVLLLSDNIYDDTLSTMLSTSFFGYAIFNILFSVIAATILFSYLSKVNSTTAMHTMPFSRLSLYVTNYLSGILLVIVPVLINSALMLAFKGIYVENMMSASVINMLKFAPVFKTFCWNALVIFFSYSIAVLGTMVSGTTIIQFLTAGAFNALAPVLWLSAQAYASIYIYGFDFTDTIWNKVGSMHPATSGLIQNVIFAYGEAFPLKSALTYLVIAIVIIILAFVAYKYRKLETAGDPYVFKFMKYFIAFLFTYLPATLGLIIVYEELNRQPLSLAIFAIVGFVIGWMIVNKTFRIINKETFITFGSCVAIIAIIIAACQIDILGLEKKIPDANEVEMVSYHCPYIGNEYGDVYLTDPQNVNSILTVHKQIIDAKDDNLEGDGQIMRIKYFLKNGKVFSRYYYAVSTELFKNSKELESLFESKEVNNIANEVSIFNAEKSDVSFSPNLVSTSLYTMDNALFTTKEKEALISAIKKDLEERTYQEAISHRVAYAMINLSMDVTPEEFEKNNYANLKYVNNYEVYETEKIRLYLNIEFNDNYENLIALLKQMNIYEKLMPREEYGYIEIISPYRYNENEYIGEKTLCRVTDTNLQRDIVSKASYTHVEPIAPDDLLQIAINSYDFNGIEIQKDEIYVSYYGTVRYSDLPESVKEMVDSAR